MPVIRLLLILCLIPSASFASTSISFYSSPLVIGDVVQAYDNPNNLLIITDVIAIFDGDTFSVTSPDSIIAYDNSNYRHSGSYISNWLNPDGSPPRDIFVYSVYQLVGFDVLSGFSTWTNKITVYGVEFTSSPLTKVPISETEFTAAYVASTPSATDSNIIRQTFSDVQTLKTDLSSLNGRVANMDPLTITQSISFLLGAFSSLAFVVASSSISL